MKTNSGNIFSFLPSPYFLSSNFSPLKSAYQAQKLLWELFGQGRKEETKAKSGLMKEYRLLGDRTDWSMGEGDDSRG